MARNKLFGDAEGNEWKSINLLDTCLASHIALWQPCSIIISVLSGTVSSHFILIFSDFRVIGHCYDGVWLFTWSVSGGGGELCDSLHDVFAEHELAQPGVQMK